MADLEAKFRITSEKGGAEAAAKSVADLKKRTEDLNTPLANTRKIFDQLNQAGEKFTKTGLKMATTGAAMMAPMMLAANSYIKNAGMAEQVSRDWLKTTDDLASAQHRVGRVVAQETLPYMQKMAELSQAAASFAEAHPEAVKAAVATGSVLTVGGTGMLFIGQAAHALSGLALIAPKLGLGGAAGGAALGAAGVLGAGAGGVALGAGVVQYLASRGFKANVGGVGLEARNLGEYPVAGVYGAVKALGGSEREATQTALELARALGMVSTNAQQAATKLEDNAWYGQALQMFTQYSIQQKYAQQDHYRDMLRMGADYQREIRHQEENYGIQRAIAVRNQGIQLNYAEQDYYRQRGIASDAFQRSLYLAEQEYYWQRGIASRNFAISQSRNAEDYALQTARNEYDHKIRLRNAARTGNAIAWLEEQRAYKLSEARREEDFGIARRRAKEDFNLSEGDSRTAFQRQQRIATENYAIQEKIQSDSYAIQRQRSQEQFELQLNDQDMNFARQMRIVAEQHDIQMSRFEIDFGIEKERQAIFFGLSLASLGAFRDEYGAILDGIKPQFAEFLNGGIVDPLNQLRGSVGLEDLPQVVAGASMAASIGGTIAGGAIGPFSGGGTVPGGGGGGGAGGYRASGGYAGFGNYRLGEQGYEFVLDHTTTKMWESALGGSLTQGALRSGTADTLEITFRGDVPDGMNMAAIEEVVSRQIADKYKRVNARVRR